MKNARSLAYILSEDAAAVKLELQRGLTLLSPIFAPILKASGFCLLGKSGGTVRLKDLDCDLFMGVELHGTWKSSLRVTGISFDKVINHRFWTYKSTKCWLSISTTFGSATG